MSDVITVVDDRDVTELSKLKRASFIIYIPLLGQRPGISSNDFTWIIGVTPPVTVGVGSFVPRHWRYSLGIKFSRRLNHWFKFSRGNFRCASVDFPRTVPIVLRNYERKCLPVTIQDNEEVSNKLPTTDHS